MKSVSTSYTVMNEQQMNDLFDTLDFAEEQEPPRAEAGAEYFQEYSVHSPFAKSLFDRGLVVNIYFTDWCHMISPTSQVSLGLITYYALDANRQVVPDSLPYTVTAENAAAWKSHWQSRWNTERTFYSIQSRSQLPLHTFKSSISHGIRIDHGSIQADFCV